jgi:nucleoid-associated protein YgaU
MAKKTQQFSWNKFLSERSQAITSGVLAIILIILAFLAFDTLSQTKQSTKNNDKSNKEQTLGKEDKPAETNSTTEETTDQGTINYTVLSGDSLWKIAVKMYNDGYQWVKIANENNISNPDKIEKGQILKISKNGDFETSDTKTSNQKTSSIKITYTVQQGDSLWTIAQRFYGGNGYDWVQIHWANPDKIDLLSNGRPRIEPGTVLTIPQLK